MMSRLLNRELFLVGLIVVVSYGITVFNGLVLDDRTLLSWDKIHTFHSKDLWLGANPPGHEGVYRPVRNILYSIDFYFFGSNPMWYHIQGIILHVAIAGILFSILTRFVERKVAFYSSLIFTVHPIHVEAISYLTASMDTFGVFFLLLSVWLLLKFDLEKKRKYLMWSVIVASISYFTNEITLVLPLIFVLLNYLKPFSGSLKDKLAYFSFITIPAIVYIFIRFVVLNITVRGVYPGESVVTTFYIMCSVFAKYFWLTIIPYPIAHNHEVVRGVEAFIYRGYNHEFVKSINFIQPQVFISFLFLLLLVGCAVYFFKKNKLITFSIAWFFVCLIPVSEIVPQGSVMNERVYYLASIGPILMTGWILGKRIGRFGKLMLIGVLIVFGVLTIQRNQDWKNEKALWKRDIKISPNTNAYAYYQLGNIYFNEKNINEARLQFQKAFKINPKMAIAAGSIARTYEKESESRAIDWYKRAILSDPGFWEGYMSLSTLNRNDAKKALEYYHKAESINPYVPLLKPYSSTKIIVPPIEGITIKEDMEKTLITDKLGLVKIQVSVFSLFTHPETYFQKENEVANLINSGPALIPHFENAYVKIYETNKIQFAKFYLFTHEDVIEIVVYPLSERATTIFDQVVQSLQVK